MAAKQPNILIIMTDQLRSPPVYESEEVRRFRRETLIAEESLRKSGISFKGTIRCQQPVHPVVRRS